MITREVARYIPFLPNFGVWKMGIRQYFYDDMEPSSVSEGERREKKHNLSIFKYATESHRLLLHLLHWHRQCVPMPHLVSAVGYHFGVNIT